MPVETFPLVRSASIDRLPVYYHGGGATTILIHSPASALGLHAWVESSKVHPQDVTPKPWLESGTENTFFFLWNMRFLLVLTNVFMQNRLSAEENPPI